MLSEEAFNSIEAFHRIGEERRSSPGELVVRLQPDLDKPSLGGYTLDIRTGGINMVTRIQKWGNSQGLRLAKQVLEDAHISVGDDVDVTTRDGLIVIAPARRVRGRRSLQELVSRIPKGYKAEEMDWGGPMGKEAW
jgi:antitoxin MazE